MKTTQGFTLIEVIIVIMVIAIISIFAVPKWTGSPLNLEMQASMMLGDINYAQAMSMATGQRYRWVMLSSTSYQIVNEAGTAVTLPSGSTTQTLTSASFGSLGNLPNNLLAFSAQGVPYVTSTIPGTALASTATIPITFGGLTATITITPTTGFGVIS